MFRVYSLAAVVGCLLYQAPARAQDADDDADSAIIKVYVPQDARVLVNGREVADGDSQGLVEFETRALAVGRRYSYEVEAQVLRNGQWVTDRVSVLARAGKLYSVYPDLVPAQTAAYGNNGYGNNGGYSGYNQGGGYTGYTQGGGYAGSAGYQGMTSSFGGGGPRGNIPGSYALINGQKVFIPAGSHLPNNGGFHGGYQGGGFHGGYQGGGAHGGGHHHP